MSSKQEHEFVLGFAPFGRLLDVGAAHNSGDVLRPHCQSYTGIDMQAHPNVDIVHDLTHPIDLEPFDDITLISVLEHSQYVWKVAENVERLLKPGGRMIITVPFSWRVHAYPSDYWRMTKEGVKTLFPNIVFKESTIREDVRHESHPKGPVMVFASGYKVI